jgi:hypothetical protein
MIEMGDFIMKQLIMVATLLLTSSLSYASAYTCTAYVNGEVVDTLTVNASKALVAEEKAVGRLKKRGRVVDYVECK